MWLVPAKVWIRQYLHNSFLLSLKKGKDYIDEPNKCTACQGVVLDKSSTSTVEKVAGKLATKFNQGKGSWERNKIRSGKTHIIIRSGETVNAATVEEQLHQAEVNSIHSHKLILNS